MRSNDKKRPTRRKPGRPHNQHKYSTVDRYEPPWWTAVYAIVVFVIIVGGSWLMSWLHLNGWY